MPIKNDPEVFAKERKVLELRQNGYHVRRDRSRGGLRERGKLL